MRHDSPAIKRATSSTASRPMWLRGLPRRFSSYPRSRATFWRRARSPLPGWSQRSQIVRNLLREHDAERRLLRLTTEQPYQTIDQWSRTAWVDELATAYADLARGEARRLMDDDKDNRAWRTTRGQQLARAHPDDWYSRLVRQLTRKVT